MCGFSTAQGVRTSDPCSGQGSSVICSRNRREVCMVRVQRSGRKSGVKAVQGLEDCDWEFGFYSSYTWKPLECFELGIDMVCFSFLLPFSPCTFPGT